MANSLKFHSTNRVLFGSILDKSGNEIPIITDMSLVVFGVRIFYFLEEINCILLSNLDV